MNLAEIEQRVRELPATERQQFVSWIYAHEDELIEPPHADAIAPEVVADLLRRRRELDDGTARIIELDELAASMSEAVDEVHRSRH